MKIVDVAAAVLLRADGAFLLARRPEGKVYAGWWEFPGGKVEAGEAPSQALATTATPAPHAPHEA